jgi:hypothetical protein
MECADCHAKPSEQTRAFQPTVLPIFPEGRKTGLLLVRRQDSEMRGIRFLCAGKRDDQLAGT